ncbi:NlpC/P60 family protein [Evansella sp. LMS18]|jgi:cell wall-associated NlpC family hydrolase|uniref:C40 family peptidase n=1 Tax=Evansella sp. LMS18 TaxID=2924033 RepID=UPI0020D0C060|nr:NlpC/P60 family protein [Evansella sp. LMS18]UTR12573.1 NlpC/P60 family protein [Evansella sp. LMS18]
MKKFIMSIALAGAFFAVPAISEASMNIGDRGDDVRQLQSALNSNGKSIAVDGVFGPETLGAVKAYQLSNSISSPAGNFYGTAGPATASALGLSSSNGGTQTATRTTSTASSTASSSSSATSSSASGVISTARSLIGSSYVWGGTTPSGFDCSGFIQYSFAQNGTSLPRTVAQMWSAGTSVSNPQAGDLVFFETRTGPSHAGIYLGNNQFIHAGSSTGVTISDMNSSYWGPRYLGAKRF